MRVVRNQNEDKSPPGLADVARDLQGALPQLLSDIPVEPSQQGNLGSPYDGSDGIGGRIARRLLAINHQLLETRAAYESDIDEAARIFLHWMEEASVVRVVGAGRARLAAAIPANRLSHGGARVFVQDDIVPMPHTIKGGGIIAASASGKTPAVLQTLETTRKQTRDVQIVGIAAEGAATFRSYCDVFIGIVPPPPGFSNPLRALADSEEYVISGLLDAIVVAAGWLGGFGPDRWKIGHENIGPTGPYDLGRNGDPDAPTEGSAP